MLYRISFVRKFLVVLFTLCIINATAQNVYFAENSGTNTGSISKASVVTTPTSTKTIIVNNANISTMGNERDVFLDHVNGFVYWCEGNSTNSNWGVYRAPISPTPATSANAIITGFLGAALSPWGVTVDISTNTLYVMYSNTGQTDKIKKYTLSSLTGTIASQDYASSGTDVVTGIDVGRYIAVDYSVTPNMIYWSDQGATAGRAIYRAPVNTTTAASTSNRVNNPVLSYTTDDQPHAIAIDPTNQRVYWVDANINSGSGTGTATTAKICYVPTNASSYPTNPIVLYNAGTVYGWGLALDRTNQVIYYGENSGVSAGQNEIRKFSISNPSGTVTNAVTGLDAIKSIKVDVGTFIQPDPVTSTTWNGSTWSNGIPTASLDAIIASNTAPASFTCKALTINSTFALTTTGITATVNGNITNNGNGIAGTGGLTIAANSTISGNAISFNGALTVNTGATLTTGGLLTLTSNATNTARVANSAGNISGNVTVQRYFANKRAWRFLTAPTFNATTVNLSAGWQTQTHIVGPSGTGLDIPAKAGYSFMTYAANTWTGVNNTNTTSQMLGVNSSGAKAFAAFLTGDRSVNINSLLASSALTLSSTGSLLTGTQTINAGTLNTGNYFFVANPYASPVDLNQVFLNAGTSNINRTFYTWDPTLSGTGGYVTISWNTGTSSYDITPATAQTQHVQSGQAFFVQATTNAATNVVFEENDKSTTTINNVFGVGNGNIDNLNINLQRIDNGSISTRDGVMASFGAAFNKAIVATEDADKLFNNEEGITIRRNNKSLSIERRPYITNTNDTIFLGLNRLVPNTNYTLNLNAQGWDAGMQAFLVDRLLSTETLINLQSANQDVSISSTVADEANRWMIVFRGTGNLPNNKLSLVATKKNKDVQLTWNIANEIGVKEYELQRSIDGTNFLAINNQVASNKGEYNNLDTKANNGINYYRVKMTMLNDDTRYSNIITINLQHLTSNIITVYPNPVKGNIAQIQLNDLAAGDYTIKLIDMNGKLIQVQNVKHQGGTASRSLSLTNVAVGTYQLLLEGKGISETVSLVKGN